MQDRATLRLLPTGRAQEAAHQHAIALKEDPLNLMARAEHAVCLLAERGFAIAPWFKPMVGLLAAVLTRMGETDRAEALVQQHLSPEKGYVDPIGPAVFHLVRGDACSRSTTG